MTSRAWAIAWPLTLALGCRAESVDARAIWVDDFGGDGRRRIHIYDRGELSELEVVGASEPVERVRLDPVYGAGVLVRSGEHSGAWFDLDDGRRFPLVLPGAPLWSPPPVSFGLEALAWIDDVDESLAVVPLAPGIELARSDDGSVEPLRRGSGLSWVLAGRRAPILFVADTAFGGGVDRASFVRYPTNPDDARLISLEAEASGLTLPDYPQESRACESALDCRVAIAVDPFAEVAMFSTGLEGTTWEIFERRAPELAGPLELPDELADGKVGLLAILDRSVSIWLGAGQLHRYDRLADRVDSIPMFAVPPLRWTTVDGGRALILGSSSGAVYRADLDGLRAISVETTVCAGPGEQVVSPSGRWIAWTCVDIEAEVTTASGVVVRVSPDGLERYVGVPMATLAIDDDGDLLLYSVDSSVEDEVDGVGQARLPRNLFSLSGDGVLTRIDELEPAPVPVLVGNGELASYMQGVALGVWSR